MTIPEGKKHAGFLRQEGVGEALIARIEQFRAEHPAAEGDMLRIPSPKFRYYGREIWEPAITAILSGENILLVGPKATGKNVLAENLSAVFGRPEWDVSFYLNTDASSLIGTDTFRNGEVSFRKGPIYACAEAGGFGVLDEINMAKNESLAVLHATLDFRRIIDVPGYRGGYSLGSKMTESELRAFLETKFGKSIYPVEQVARLEKRLCTGNHKFTHLFYTRGEVGELRGIYNTFELHQRKRQEEVIAGNRAYYQKHLLQNRLLIARLSTGIMNSVLLHMQPSRRKANTGALDPGLAWRAARLGDERVFQRTENENAGDISVDILLDASHSQVDRAARISSQAYIIAEALSRCRVPCRVMSFCSMSGFTIMRLFNDYSSGGNGSIFDYYAEGCSRDGLAIRAAGDLMRRAPYEHKLLIVLSDVKPLDAAAKIRKDERDIGVPYDSIRALTDTAHEVRRLRADGVSVICLFTGEDDNLPAAKLVYGQDFVRIRDFSYFADTVGKLILDQMKNYSV